MNNDEQQIFIEALDNLKEYAKLNFGVITRKDILDNFGGVELEESQLQLIYGYLQNNSIKISDVELAENAFEKINSKALENSNDEDNDEDPTVKSLQKAIDDENDRKYVEMYLEDLKAVKEISEAEESELISKIIKGDQNAELTLIEGYLPKIVKMVEVFRGKGVPSGDLIQESNLILMTLIKEGHEDDLEKFKNEFSRILNDRINEVCNLMIEEHNGSAGISQKILNKVNAVNDCAVRLSQELGRKVTVEEVANNMGISSEAVREAMDFSSNKIEDIKVSEKDEK